MRKSFADIVLLLTVLLVGTGIALADTDVIVLGDVNSDGSVTTADVTALVNYLHGSGTVNAVAADVNHDGDIDIADVTAINNIISSGTFDNFDDPSLTELVEAITPDFTIKEGPICDTSKSFKVMREGKVVATILLGEPIIVDQAEDEEPWGYYQFPTIYRNEDKNLIVKWSMKADAIDSYGLPVTRRNMMMSSDEGKTWTPLDKEYAERKRTRCELSNGNILQEEHPASADITKYSNFPAPVNNEAINNSFYYYVDQLPDDLQGVYFSLWDWSTGNTKQMHSKVTDPGLLRYSTDNLMPVIWTGNIRELSDGSLIAGVYPTTYLDEKGNIQKSSITFYLSSDIGNSWSKQGTIFYQPDLNADPDGNKASRTFTEPTFVVLNNGNLLCVMRTGAASPMYKSYSSDKGVTWSKPEAFTSNGVRPTMIKLDNDVLALASGRPGVQLRINIDGTGEKWTEPIDMVHYMDSNGTYSNTTDVSCGYADMIPCDNGSFFLVYTDFKKKRNDGEERKTILFRKVTVKVRL